MKRLVNWFNLKKNKCPKCGKDWTLDLEVRDGLLAHGCGFKIRERRYREIVADMVNKEIEEDSETEEAFKENLEGCFKK